MTVRQRNSGSITLVGDRFRVRISEGGKRVTLGTFATHEEAELVLEARKALHAAGRVETGGTLLRDYGERWLDRRELDGARDIRNDRSRWRTHVLTSSLAGMPLESIGRRDVKLFLDDLRKKDATPRQRRRGAPAPRRKPLSVETVKRVLSLLKALFQAAVDDELIPANPARELRLPKRAVMVDEGWTYLMPDEQRRIHECDAPEADKLMVLVAMYTGIRQSEQWALRLDDIILDDGYPRLIVRRGLDDGATKSGKARVVPLLPAAVQAFERWLELLPTYAPKNPHNLLFPTQRGCRRQKSKRPRFEAVLKAARIVASRRHDGRSVRWHDLRHTCASSLVAGWWGRVWRIEEVRDLLGHSTIKVTERYAHLAPSVLQAAAAVTHQSGPDLDQSKKQRSAQVPEIIGRARHDSNVRPADSKSGAKANNVAPIGVGRSTFGPELAQLAERYIQAVASRNRFSNRYGIELAEAVLEAAGVEAEELLERARHPGNKATG